MNAISVITATLTLSQTGWGQFQVPLFLQTVDCKVAKSCWQPERQTAQQALGKFNITVLSTPWQILCSLIKGVVVTQFMGYSTMTEVGQRGEFFLQIKRKFNQRQIQIIRRHKQNSAKDHKLKKKIRKILKFLKFTIIFFYLLAGKGCKVTFIKVLQQHGHHYHLVEKKNPAYGRH